MHVTLELLLDGSVLEALGVAASLRRGGSFRLARESGNGGLGSLGGLRLAGMSRRRRGSLLAGLELEDGLKSVINIVALSKGLALF